MHTSMIDSTAYSVGLYIRLSKEDEHNGPSESVTNQCSLLTEFVQRHSLSVYDTYIDDGWSGTDFERPAFLRMIDDIEANKINMVITKDLSRLGRDYIMTGHYMERYFPEKGVRYISLLDGIDTGVESTANDITPFRAIMNDMYAKDISKKIRSVKHDKQRKGQFIGGKPVYGYKMHPTEKNKIVIDDSAAHVVRRIFTMALNGMSCRKIAITLNSDGIPSPSAYCGRTISSKAPYSGLWSSERISQMLQNETYIGNMVQGRSVKLNYKSKKCVHQPPEKWIIVENTHEALIDKASFEKVNRLLGSRRHTRTRTYDFLFKGLIFCHECGYPLSVINRPSSSGEDRLFLICRTYQRFTGADLCTCHSVKEQTVTNAVLSKVYCLCKNHINFEQLKEIADNAATRLQNPYSKSELNIINCKLNRIISEVDKIYRDRLSGLLSEEDFLRIYRRINDERTTLQNALNKMEKDKNTVPDIVISSDELVEQFLEQIYTSRELLVSLIERIELTENKEILVKFRFRKPETISYAQSFTIAAANSIPH